MCGKFFSGLSESTNPPPLPFLPLSPMAHPQLLFLLRVSERRELLDELKSFGGWEGKLLVTDEPAQMQEALNVCLLQLRNPQLYGPASGRPYSPIWENSGETPERVRRNSGAEETPDSLRKF